MSYVDKSLMPGEPVIATAHTHWWVYARAILMLLLALVLAGTGATRMDEAHRFATGELLSEANILYLEAIVCLVLSASLFVRVWLGVMSAELAVTSVRIIVKTGLIRRSSVDLLNRNVESVYISQSILGRILNFGTIRIHGTGGVWTPSPLVSNPLEFRRQALSAIEHRKGTP